MFHNRWYKSLSAYLDGELKGNQKAEYEKHLAHCSLCQAKHAAWSKLSLSSAPFPLELPPDNTWQQIASRINTEQPIRKSFWESLGLYDLLPNPIEPIIIALLLVIAVVAVQPYFKSNEIADNSNDSYALLDENTNAHTDTMTLLMDDLEGS